MDGCPIQWPVWLKGLIELLQLSSLATRSASVVYCSFSHYIFFLISPKILYNPCFSPFQVSYLAWKFSSGIVVSKISSSCMHFCFLVNDIYVQLHILILHSYLFLVNVCLTASSTIVNMVDNRVIFELQQPQIIFICRWNFRRDSNSNNKNNPIEITIVLLLCLLFLVICY